MPQLCKVFYRSFDNLDGLVLMEKETVIESVSLIAGKVIFVQLYYYFKSDTVWFLWHKFLFLFIYPFFSKFMIQELLFDQNLSKTP